MLVLEVLVLELLAVDALAARAVAAREVTTLRARVLFALAAQSLPGPSSLVVGNSEKLLQPQLRHL